jgi:hypothetical protein
MSRARSKNNLYITPLHLLVVSHQRSRPYGPLPFFLTAAAEGETHRNGARQTAFTKTMPRYYFELADGSPFLDPVGEELPDDHAAWIEALRTVRDVESTLDLETSPRWSIEVRRDGRPIFRIDVSAQKCPTWPS